MNFMEGLKVALDCILSNKLRSFLTMLGIIIGISSVIAIVAIGEGGKSFISGQFEKIGANTVEVSMNDKSILENDYFTLDDIYNIKSKIAEVKSVSPMINRRGIIKGSKIVKDAIITGITGDYSSIFNVEMLYGRFINDKDVFSGKNVIVIDDVIAKKLFGYTNCIGETVKVGGRLNQMTAIVCGIMKSSTEFIAGFAGDSFPAFTYVPVTYLKKMFSEDFTINQLELALYNNSSINAAVQNVIRFLERTHHNSDKYKAQNLLSQLDKLNSILDKFTLIISAIAAISLLVGGIGVMNIMLVSVSERTREIGIRKALGATKGNIMFQFLTESVIISLFGGIIGLIIGFAIGFLLSSIMGLSSFIPLWVVLLVVGLTSMVGIFFGIYPASKAAALDPIEALRYE